jgi:hypothetical protein
MVYSIKLIFNYFRVKKYSFTPQPPIETAILKPITIEPLQELYSPDSGV